MSANEGNNVTTHRPPLAPDRDALAEAVRRRMEPFVDRDGPGAVIGVGAGRSVIMNGAYGLARISPLRPLDSGVLMPIASISKQFTAACALELDRRRQFDIDKPLGAYIPELQPEYRTPTVRQLLDHTSGLRCLYDLLLFSGFESARPDDYVLESVHAVRSLNAEPGKWQVYGNLGFELAARAIERATGENFYNVLRATILSPLGLENIVPVRSGEIAHVYSGAWGERRDVTHLIPPLLGAGGLAASLDDLLAWARAVRVEDARLHQAVWRGLQKRPALQVDAGWGYALGTAIMRWRGLEMIGHSGSLAGVSTTLISVPKADVDVVVLANTELPTDAIARGILEDLLGEAWIAPEPKPALARHAQDLAGSVFADADLVIGFEASGERLTFSYQGVEGIPLHDEGANFVFAGATGPITIIPTDPTSRLVVEAGGERHVLHRLAPAPSIQAFGSVEGSYRNDELGVALAIHRDGNELRVQTTGQHGTTTAMAIAMAPDLLKVSGQFLRCVLRIIRDGDAVVSLQLDTARTRHFALTREDGAVLNGGSQ